MLRIFNIVLIILLTSIALAGNVWADKYFSSKKLFIHSSQLGEYLGLNKDVQNFYISQIQSQIVIIEIFSMYCPHCQREAPKINELYELISKQRLADKIKIIGIAPNNSEFEINIFKKKYNIDFPLFPDPDNSWHKIFGQIGTPSFFVVLPGQEGRVVYSQEGGFDSPQEFLQLIKVKSGLVLKK